MLNNAKKSGLEETEIQDNIFYIYPRFSRTEVFHKLIASGLPML